MAVRSVGAVLACALLVLGISGCTEPSPPTVLPSVTGTASSTTVSSPPTSPTTSSPSSPATAASTTPPSPDAKTQIIAQWQKYFSLVHSLQGQGPQEQTQALLAVATPKRVGKTVQFLQERAGRGEKEYGNYKFGPAEVVVHGSAATVTECRDESNLVVKVVASGTVVGHGEPTLKLTAKMSLSSKGIWQLVTFDASHC